LPGYREAVRVRGHADRQQGNIAGAEGRAHMCSDLNDLPLAGLRASKRG
jgi:hypothetical protein